MMETLVVMGVVVVVVCCGGGGGDGGVCFATGATTQGDGACRESVETRGYY